MTGGHRAAELRVLHLQIDLRDGGGQHLVLDLAQRMTPMGIDSMTAYLLPEHTMLDQYRRAGIDARFVEHRSRRVPRTVSRLVSLIRHHRIDVVHTHSELDKWIGYLAAKYSGRALVTHIHGSTPWLADPRITQGFPTSPTVLKRRAVLRLSYGPYVSTAIAVSEAARDEHLAVLRCPIHVIYNGVDTTRFGRRDGRSEDVRRRLDADGRRIVLFVGRLESQKRPDLLVAALPQVLAECPDALLVIAGDGTMRAQLEEQVAALRLEAHVRFLGRVEDVVPLYGVADLFVLPSRSEGFGLAVVEAMLSGVPVVVSRLRALEEVVDDEATGILVDVDDDAAWSSAIVRVLSDQDLASRLGSSAIVAARERFDAARMTDEVVALYRSAVDQ